MKHVFLFSLFLAVPLFATDVAGPSVVIPMAGRVPGAFGSQWQTDLVITNVSRHGPNVPVTMVFSRTDGIERVATTELAPRTSFISHDVVRELFGDANGMGMLRVVSSLPDAKLAARARVYNVGSGIGEFGQIIPALPLTKLSREAYLAGLSGAHGNRTNVGIANPGPKDAGVSISLFEGDGNFRGSFSFTVEAGTVRQFNDIFYEFNAAGLDGATVQIMSTDGVYPYASIARNDSGDADFVTPASVVVDAEEAIVQPQCTNAAPLQLAPLPAAGWIVMFRNGTNATEMTSTLAARYAFTPAHVYDATGGFAAELSHAVIAALRCEASVASVQQNARVPVN